MKLTIVGSGDAFGSGGRLQTCFHVKAENSEFLVDCGATAVIGFNKLGLDPNRVEVIFISHLHGDHFAGLVWWLIHAIYVVRRTRPLAVAGPRGIAERFHAAAEALFPGSTTAKRLFELTFAEYETGKPLSVHGVKVTPFEVSHPSGAPSYALRLEVDGKVLSYSGDTEWVESLVPCASGADLYISECYGFESPARYHMNWITIQPNLGRLGAKKVLLTHMSAEMLANGHRIEDSRVQLAGDGLTLDI